jgi:hypothetical protein
MNKRQQLVQAQFLNNEEAVIKRLKQVYGQSLKDINGKISNLDSSIAMLQEAYSSIDGDDIGDLARAVLGSKKNFTPEEAQETLQSMIQSKVYQKKYQTALQKQVGSILDTMHEKEFKVVSDYLDKCYEDGFVGTMFDLQGQGIPLCFPLDQEAMVRAVQLDSKISHGLYSRLGEDVALLKKKITAQVSRGISTGMSFQQVAQQLAGYTNIGYNNAVRIARTEGHRIQVQGTMDACYKAKEKGADVVKQWDSTLDGATRESHQAVDGEIRELDKPFSNGLIFPGDPSGGAAEVVNCRCALLQRAKWALDEDELETLKERAAFYGLDKAETFEDYKKQYLKAAKKESEVQEIKNALDFGYGDLTQDDYNKWWDDYESHNSGVHLSKEELKAIDDYTEGGFITLNDVGRYSDSELLKKGYSAEDIAQIRKKADTLDGALAKYDLDTDIVTHRFERDVSWLTGKGNDIADLEELIGKEYTAKGFTSSGMLPNRFRFTGGKKDAVHFEIVTPKGTNGAFLSMSKKGENEFLYNRNTRFKILDGGERVVKERKLNIRTMQLEDVDVTERFLKVQVIVDDVADVTDDVISGIIKAEKLDASRFPSAFSVRSEKKNTERFVEYVNSREGASADTIRLYNSMGKLESVETNGIPFKISHGKNHAVKTTARYNGDLVEVRMNIPKLSGDNLAGQINTTLHEEMHLMDLYCRTDPKKAGDWFSSSRTALVDVFKNTSAEMSDDISNLFKEFGKEYNNTKNFVYTTYKQKRDDLRESYFPNGESVWSDIRKYREYEKEAKKLEKWYEEELDYQCRNIMGGGINNLQDIYDALSGGGFRDNGTVKYGHGSRYYTRTSARVHETIANYGALSVTRPDLIEMLRKDKPDLVTELEATVKEMLKKVGD